MSTLTKPLPLAFAAPRERALPLRVAVICDFAEENWPSMNLVGDMLFEQLHRFENIAPRQIRPAMKFSGRSSSASVRFFARFVQYPNLCRLLGQQFDLFHIVDHSYAHLVHHLPPARTIVTCHDLDAFRCLLEPNTEPRSLPFRLMTRRVLRGLQAAAGVTCSSAATSDAILRHRLVSGDRLTVVHNGVHPFLTPRPDRIADETIAQRLRRQPGECLELLHVGSTIVRKRIDVLLRIFAEVRRHHPQARLIRVGTGFTPGQRSLAQALGVVDAIDELQHVDVRLLASCYRRATAVLQPSDAEGFGLPVIEAMACGTPVVASDIPALREVGASAALFCPVGDISAWSKAVLTVLSRRQDFPVDQEALIRNAARFTWNKYASQMLAVYQKVLA